MDFFAKLLYAKEIMRHLRYGLSRRGRIFLTLIMLLAGLCQLPAYAAEPKAVPPVPVPKPFATPASLTTSAPAEIKKATVRPEGALNIPRPTAKPDFLKAPASGDGALPASDIPIYREIFSYQARGKWKEADKRIGQLKDGRLMGHVLYQRYMHPTAYRSSFTELKAWLERYYDHPDADRIYKLAVARKPKNFNGYIKRPETSVGVSGFLEVLFGQNSRYYSPRRRTSAQKREIASLKKTIRRHINNGGPTAAYKKLLASPASTYLDKIEYDSLRALIARSYMYEGKLEKAYELARSSAESSGNKEPMAGWVAGLAAWQLGQYHEAGRFFTMTATSPYASSWAVSAGAYWASRSYMRTGDIREVSRWLQKAAAHPRTFYGLIATRALGWDFDFNWLMPRLDKDHLEVLSDLPAGKRALSLVLVGQYHLAERELRQINPGSSAQLLEALLAYGHKNDLPSFVMRLAEAVPGPGGSLYDAALYPLSPWEPEGGYRVDRALIHAIIRQESRFDPYAESHSGAAGLMQLMPATASYIAGRRDFREASGRHYLKDPRINLDLGQRYIESLLSQDGIDSELFALATAYNAGPGNLRKWKRKMTIAPDDPLLFIEMVPMAETRAFVERVMSNYWIYRLRLKQPTPSLDAVAEGNWAHYVRLDKDRHARQAMKASPISLARD